MSDALKVVSVTFCGTVNASEDPNLNQVKLYGVCLFLKYYNRVSPQIHKLAILVSGGFRKFPAEKVASSGIDLVISGL